MDIINWTWLSPALASVLSEKTTPFLCPAPFFYWVLDLFTVAILPTCSKAAAPLCFLSLTIGDYNTRKAVARQFAWYLWKQFLLSVSVAPTWASHRQKWCCKNVMVRACCKARQEPFSATQEHPLSPVWDSSHLLGWAFTWAVVAWPAFPRQVDVPVIFRFKRQAIHK